MTADEIRNIHLNKACCHVEDTAPIQLYDCAFMLREIAAQLSELNANLLLVRDSTEAMAIDGISVKVRQ